MSKIRLPLLLAALSLAGSAAHASIESPAQRIEIVAPRATPAEVVDAVRHIDTQYEMSDGRRMTVAAAPGQALHVRYGRRMAQVLEHDGTGNFVSRNGLVSLRFELDGRGAAHVAHLTMPASWQ